MSKHPRLSIEYGLDEKVELNIYDYQTALRSVAEKIEEESRKLPSKRKSCAYIGFPAHSPNAFATAEGESLLHAYSNLLIRLCKATVVREAVDE